MAKQTKKTAVPAKTKTSTKKPVEKKAAASTKTSTKKPAENTATASDVEQNKTMAIIAYLLFFVPLLTGDHEKSPFVKFHTNQGLVLFLAAVVGTTAASILIIVLIGLVLLPLVCLACLALCIIGIINAVNGQMKPLPIIGKITLIK